MERKLKNIKFSRIDDVIGKVRSIQNSPNFQLQYRLAIKHQNDPKKCTSQSDSYRAKGNQRYAERKFIPALENFNKSICFAPERSEQLAKGYANRSAAYFSMQMFDLSLKNIKMARESGYPERLALKLNVREAKCMSELQKLETKPKHEFHNMKPQLSYPPHEKVPFIANCLDLKVNEKYGRYVVTKCDLKVGEVIAIEQPFCAAITPEARYIFCSNCFRENDLNLIPCPNCHSVMFCSPECLAAANEAFHTVECPVMDTLTRCNAFDYPAYMAFRLFIVAMKKFESADDLMKFINDLINREQNVFNVNYEQSPDIDMLASTFKLSCFSLPKSIANFLSYTAIMTRILLDFTIFKEKFKSKEETDFLIELFAHLCDLMTCHGADGIQGRAYQPESDITKFTMDSSCIAVYPFTDLLNHACAHNVRVVKHGIQNVMIVIKPIKSGEQLFRFYMSIHHSIMDRETRQKTLREYHKFTCDCLACVKNYPMLSAFDNKQRHPLINSKKHNKICKEYNIEAAKELIPKHCDLLTVSSARFPEFHTVLAEDMLFDLFTLIYNEVPLAHKLNLTK